MSELQFVSIQEFLSLTRLEANELCAMLSAGELSGTFADDGSLRIDISKLDTTTLATRSTSLHSTSALPSNRLEEEELASEVLEFLDLAIDEALVLADSWHKKAVPENSE